MNKWIYNPKVLAERLKKKRKEANIKSQREFADIFNSRYKKINEEDQKNTSGILGSIKHYESGNYVPYPDLDILQKFSSILNCDSGYLLGFYDESEKGLHDISGQTGLSEEAIRFLQTLHDGTDGNSLNILSLINELLTTEIGQEFLNSLVFIREHLFYIDYELRNQFWTTDTSIEELRSAEKNAKYSILEAQESFQRFVYEQQGARSTLKELSELILRTPESRPPLAYLKAEKRQLVRLRRLNSLQDERRNKTKGFNPRRGRNKAKWEREQIKPGQLQRRLTRKMVRNTSLGVRDGQIPMVT